MKMYVGIDVAKDTLAVALPQTTTSWKVRSIRNTPEAIRKLINELPDQRHVVLEATGSYSVLLTYLLCQAQMAVSVINPKQSHHFAQLQLAVTKTDESDAVLLARYGQLVQPPCYTMESDVLLRLKQKRTLLRHFKKQQRSLANLQHAFSPLPVQDEQVGSSLQQLISHFQTAIAEVTTEIEQLTTQHFPDQLRRLTSIQGISTTIATALIEVTSGFAQFHSAKALAKYIGVVPVIYQSGKSQITKGICKTGDPQLRSMLYMASWSAIRYNKPCRALYQRLKAAGKAPKVALLAVVNKLLRQAFAVVKFNQDFDPDYQPILRPLPCFLT
jgi:transposase